MSALYASNAHNQLLEDEDYTYAYDERGNRVSRTAKADGAVETYTYDSQNRLVGYASPTTTASYAYDAMERRIAKTVDGEKTAYVYDTSIQYPLHFDDIMLEFQQNSLSLDRRWVHSNVSDEPLGFEVYFTSEVAGSGVIFELFADRHSSILWSIEVGSGTVASEQSYDEYGNATNTESNFQIYGFTGREFDEETGLYFYRARHYDPATGSFVQSDPIGFLADDLNIYRYVENNPTRFVDPNGLVKKKPNGRHVEMSMQDWLTTEIRETVLALPLKLDRQLHRSNHQKLCDRTFSKTHLLIDILNQLYPT